MALGIWGDIWGPIWGSGEAAAPVVSHRRKRKWSVEDDGVFWYFDNLQDAQDFLASLRPSEPEAPVTVITRESKRKITLVKSKPKAKAPPTYDDEDDVESLLMAM